MKILETPVTLALLSGIGSLAAILPASMAAQENPEAQAGRQFLSESCDTSADNYISAEEARACAEQHYGATGGGEASMSADQFGKAFPGPTIPQSFLSRSTKTGMERSPWPSG